jgi:hypothetical protein
MRGRYGADSALSEISAFGRSVLDRRSYRPQDLTRMPDLPRFALLSARSIPGGFAVRVTQEVAIQPDVVERYWRLYEDAFAPLARVAAQRQTLFKEEFYEAMTDERIIKFVLWDDDEPVGMALVATDLAAVPWVSSDYFAHRFPEHFAEGRAALDRQAAHFRAEELDAQHYFAFIPSGFKDEGRARDAAS